MPLTIVKEAEMFGFLKMANLAQFEYIIGWYRSILTLILIGPFFRESATNSLVRIGPKGASPDCFKCSALTRSKLSPLSPIWHWTRTRKAPNKEVGFNPGQPP